jgi:sirohydrochlorin ferrochelatase
MQPTVMKPARAADPEAILLVDYGSLEPAATLALRGIAARLGGVLGRTVAPVSLRHADGVPAAALGGSPAEVLESALERRAREGVNRFLVVPLFFGPGGALTGDVPACAARVRTKFPATEVRLMRGLVDVNDAADDRMAAMLEDQVRSKMAGMADRPAVILVDHGSPERAVTLVRDHLAARLAARLGTAVSGVRAASMERRPGAEYDFNEPSLDRALDETDPDARPVIVAMQFLLPGRHAGPGGDIAQICAAARRRRPGLSVTMTGLVGSHPKLIEVLADRAREARAAAPFPGE